MQSENSLSFYCDSVYTLFITLLLLLNELKQSLSLTWGLFASSINQMLDIYSKWVTGSFIFFLMKIFRVFSFFKMGTANAACVFEHLVFHGTFAICCIGCIWKVMQCTITLIASIKTLITFYLSFKAKFPVSYPGSSHRPASTVQVNEGSFSSPLPATHFIGTNARKQAGSTKSRSEAYGEWMGIFICLLLHYSLLPNHIENL